jgi:cysteinyl-tRNA synthetase
VTGKPLSRYWLHNGMVNVDGEKMSKSLGNFTTIRQLLDEPLEMLGGDRFDPMALRVFVLQAQYRKPIDFTGDAISAAKNSWNTLKDGLLFATEYGEVLGWGDKADAHTLSEEAVQRFQAAMDDDFNAPSGLAVLFELAKELRRAGNLITHQGQADRASEYLRQDWHTLVSLAQVLGLEAVSTSDEAPVDEGGDAAIEVMIQARCAARKAKDFRESDRLRDLLTAENIVLIDQPDGTTRWHRG